QILPRFLSPRAISCCSVNDYLAPFWSVCFCSLAGVVISLGGSFNVSARHLQGDVLGLERRYIMPPISWPSGGYGRNSPRLPP
ncbi:MAG: hypothetical protein QGG84_02675, partial [Rhodospirillales bacterium]|nr:hypothetical protein [Rhodospirillales bacterium]